MQKQGLQAGSSGRRSGLDGRAVTKAADDRSSGPVVDHMPVTFRIGTALFHDTEGTAERASARVAQPHSAPTAGGRIGFVAGDKLAPPGSPGSAPRYSPAPSPRGRAGRSGRAGTYFHCEVQIALRLVEASLNYPASRALRPAHACSFSIISVTTRCSGRLVMEKPLTFRPTVPMVTKSTAGVLFPCLHHAFTFHDLFYHRQVRHCQTFCAPHTRSIFMRLAIENATIRHSDGLEFARWITADSWYH